MKQYRPAVLVWARGYSYVFFWNYCSLFGQNNIETQNRIIKFQKDTSNQIRLNSEHNL